VITFRSVASAAMFVILASTASTVAFSQVSAGPGNPTNTIVMGTKTIIVKTDNVEFITCPAPTDVECFTCAKQIANPNLQGVFAHDPSSPSTGRGWDDSVLTWDGSVQTLSKRSGSNTVTTYADFKLLCTAP